MKGVDKESMRIGNGSEERPVRGGGRGKSVEQGGELRNMPQ